MSNFIVYYLLVWVIPSLIFNYNLMKIDKLSIHNEWKSLTNQPKVNSFDSFDWFTLFFFSFVFGLLGCIIGCIMSALWFKDWDRFGLFK